MNIRRKSARDDKILREEMKRTIWAITFAEASIKEKVYKPHTEQFFRSRLRELKNDLKKLKSWI